MRDFDQIAAATRTGEGNFLANATLVLVMVLGMVFWDYCICRMGSWNLTSIPYRCEQLLLRSKLCRHNSVQAISPNS
jgi:hypothetical protein